MKGLSCIMFQQIHEIREDILSCSAQWLAVGSPFSCTRPAKKTAIRNLCTDYISHLAPGVTSQGNLNHQPLNRHLLSSCLRKISELSCICLFFPRWKE